MGILRNESSWVGTRIEGLGNCPQTHEPHQCTLASTGVCEVAHFLCWEGRGPAAAMDPRSAVKGAPEYQPHHAGSKRNGQLLGCGESILLIVERGARSSLSV